MRVHEVASDQGLVRAIGVRGLTAAIVNATIGAGIFVLPAVAARDLGAAAPLAYLACAVVMTLVVASFAMAGSRVSLTGGLYAYVEVAFGPFIGFITGVLVLCSNLGASAGVANALISVVGLTLPAVAVMPGKALALALIYGLLATINIRGVRTGTRLVEVMTVTKLAPLLLLVVAGLFVFGHEAPVVQAASLDRVGSTSLLLIFAFMGIEIALVPCGEVRDPARTVPRAIFLALGLTTIVYLAVQWVAYAALGADLPNHTQAPVADAALRTFGPWGRALILAGSAISMLGFISGDMLGTPRSLFAFARNGLLPKVLARLHETYRTPATAIGTYALLTWGGATAGSFGTLILMSSVAVLTAYFLCCLAAIELRRRNVQMGGIPFDIPGGPLVPIAACGAIAWLVSHVSLREVTATAVVVPIAIGLYAIRSVRLRSIPAAVPLAGAEPEG